MGVSSDPAKAAIQRANLRPNAATKHGAYSTAKLAPLREQFVIELRKAFPSAADDQISLLAHQRAQLAALGEWMDRRGLLANKRRGTVFDAVRLHLQLANSYEKQYAALQAAERERDKDKPPSYFDLRQELPS